MLCCAGCSVAYMGFVMGAASEGTHLNDTRHNLRRLFATEPVALQDLLAALATGQVRAEAAGWCKLARGNLSCAGSCS